jgi:hypothetical protein
MIARFHGPDINRILGSNQFQAEIIAAGLAGIVA